MSRIVFFVLNQIHPTPTPKVAVGFAFTQVELDKPSPATIHADPLARLGLEVPWFSRKRGWFRVQELGVLNFMDRGPLESSKIFTKYIVL